MENQNKKEITQERIIELAYKVSAPYLFCCKLLAALLVISLLSNVYLYTRNHTVILDASDNIESDIDQTNN